MTRKLQLLIGNEQLRSGKGNIEGVEEITTEKTISLDDSKF